MRSLIALLITACVVAGCTRPAEPPGGAFARELTGRVAGAPQTCVSAINNQNLRVIDASTVAYDSGRTIYVNRLPGPCPAIAQLGTVIVDARDGSQYCRGTRIRGLETGAIIPGPWCPLGDWVPYGKP
jgi:hypothetical protein